MPNRFTNLNSLRGYLIIEELVRQGVTQFCLSPGSRSTPLTVAVAENEKAQAHVITDERAAAFFALGLARASGMPAAVITTSGTAVANLMPAVVEADIDCIPMILLTADRPVELLQTGANQTVDQIKFFQNQVRSQFSLAAPSGAASESQAFILKTVDHLVASALGFSSDRGPVHLNCHFREPLAAGEFDTKEKELYAVEKDLWRGSAAYTVYGETKSVCDLTALQEQISKAQRGLLLLGQLHSEAEKEAVAQICEKLPWPVFADITSGLQAELANSIGGFDFLLTNQTILKEYQPDFILHLGDQIISKRLTQALNIWQSEYCRVSPRGKRVDPQHLVRTRYLTSYEHLNAECSSSSESELLGGYKQLSRSLLKHFENRESAYSVVNAIGKNLKERGLVLASSLPVRDFDWFANSLSNRKVISNRGASGIDGTMATAAGYKVGLKKNVILYMGDLAFLHDLNSLRLVRDYQILVVVNNNRGGGIFSLLPIQKHFSQFEKYFATSHEENIEKISHAFGLPFAKVANTTALAKAVDTMTYGVIEVESDRQQNAEFIRELLAVARQLKLT